MNGQPQQRTLIDPRFATTLNELPGFKITRQLGFIKADASEQGGRKAALDALLAEGAARGANAVVGVRFESAIIGVNAYGTAVVLG